MIGYGDGCYLISHEPMTRQKAIAFQNRYWGMTIYELAPYRRGQNEKEKAND